MGIDLERRHLLQPVDDVASPAMKSESDGAQKNGGMRAAVNCCLDWEGKDGANARDPFKSPQARFRGSASAVGASFGAHALRP